MKTIAPKPQRCAISTRKSTEHNLDLAFNSLDAQRETGQINRRGIVDLTFRRMDIVAHVTGRLANGSGSGSWSSPSLQCVGSWHAIRHN